LGDKHAAECPTLAMTRAVSTSVFSSVVVNITGSCIRLRYRLEESICTRGEPRRTNEHLRPYPQKKINIEEYLTTHQDNTPTQKRCGSKNEATR
jgi:hypothetical protein